MSERTPQRALEMAAMKAGRAIMLLTKVFDQHGSAITDPQLIKTFNYLNMTLVDTRHKAVAARAGRPTDLSVFSLDAELPLVTAIPAAVQEPLPVETMVVLDTPSQTAPAPAPTVWRKPEGRLSGTKEPVFAPDAPKKKRPEVTDPDEAPDKTGQIKLAGFIE